MAKKTQIEKIENVLWIHNTGPGITAAAIARLARVPKEAVAKRIYDLRNDYTIYTNWRKVKGKRTAFYRMAAET